MLYWFLILFIDILFSCIVRFDAFYYTFRTIQPRNKGGLGKMNIPILSDITKQVSKDYGVLLEDQGVSLRYREF